MGAEMEMALAQILIKMVYQVQTSRLEAQALQTVACSLKTDPDQTATIPHQTHPKGEHFKGWAEPRFLLELR